MSRNFFHHRRRHDESLAEKFAYICQNPVRAGLLHTETLLAIHLNKPGTYRAQPNSRCQLQRKITIGAKRKFAAEMIPVCFKWAGCQDDLSAIRVRDIWIGRYLIMRDDQSIRIRDIVYIEMLSARVTWRKRHAEQSLISLGSRPAGDVLKLCRQHDFISHDSDHASLFSDKQSPAAVARDRHVRRMVESPDRVREAECRRLRSEKQCDG